MGFFSVALNIFLYCDMCSTFMCLHVNQRVKRTQSTSHHSNQENEELQSAKSLQVVGCS